MFLVLSGAPSLIALLGFTNFREKGKGLKPPFVLSSCDFVFFLHENYLANPNGEGVRNWTVNHISKFHDNPTVNETSIIVLLGGFGFLWEKKRLQCEMYFSQLRHLFVIPNGENAQNWVANLVLKIHDDQRWMSPRSSFFWDMFGGMRENRGFWEEERGKRNWEKEEASSVSKLT